MKMTCLAGLAYFMIATVALGETAHKGWRASPDGLPASLPRKPVVTENGATANTGAPLRNITMTAPFVGVGQPDPPTKASFTGDIWFSQNSTATVQRVYLLSPSLDGSLNPREVKTSGFKVYDKPIVPGYVPATFKTEEIDFKEGDTLVVVLKIEGVVMPVFLRIYFEPFVPS